MADAVASQTLLDGERMAIMKFTNLSDGTGESKVIKVDVSALSSSASGQACDGVTITKIHASTHGLEVQIYWDATTDVFCWCVPQNSTGINIHRTRNKSNSFIFYRVINCI